MSLFYIRGVFVYLILPSAPTSSTCTSSAHYRPGLSVRCPHGRLDLSSHLLLLRRVQVGNQTTRVSFHISVLYCNTKTVQPYLGAYPVFRNAQTCVNFTPERRLIFSGKHSSSLRSIRKMYSYRNIHFCL